MAPQKTKKPPGKAQEVFILESKFGVLLAGMPLLPHGVVLKDKTSAFYKSSNNCYLKFKEKFEIDKRYK